MSMLANATPKRVNVTYGSRGKSTEKSKFLRRLERDIARVKGRPTPVQDTDYTVKLRNVTSPSSYSWATTEAYPKKSPVRSQRLASSLTAKSPDVVDSEDAVDIWEPLNPSTPQRQALDSPQGFSEPATPVRSVNHTVSPATRSSTLRRSSRRVQNSPQDYSKATSPMVASSPYRTPTVSNTSRLELFDLTSPEEQDRTTIENSQTLADLMSSPKSPNHAPPSPYPITEALPQGLDFTAKNVKRRRLRPLSATRNPRIAVDELNPLTKDVDPRKRLFFTNTYEESPTSSLVGSPDGRASRRKIDSAALEDDAEMAATLFGDDEESPHQWSTQRRARKKLQFTGSTILRTLDHDDESPERASRKRQRMMRRKSVDPQAPADLTIDIPASHVQRRSSSLSESCSTPRRKNKSSARRTDPTENHQSSALSPDAWSKELTPSPEASQPLSIHEYTVIPETPKRNRYEPSVYNGSQTMPIRRSGASSHAPSQPQNTPKPLEQVIQKNKATWDAAIQSAPRRTLAFPKKATPSIKPVSTKALQSLFRASPARSPRVRQ
ncbi:hypothetical protein DFS34DRAFT_654267 [Phlyctochytrium arcticum]|nr:hypothetical protein DFS34DRAFT_654267 [Phlyctochytrium arcticum]